jgi:hypothetical protein
MKFFQKSVFRALAKLNRHILPKYGNKDLTQLSKFDKLIIAYRYYVTKNSLH